MSVCLYQHLVCSRSDPRWVDGYLQQVLVSALERLPKEQGQTLLPSSRPLDSIFPSSPLPVALTGAAAPAACGVKYTGGTPGSAGR